MNTHAHAMRSLIPADAKPAGSLLQRKCACGSHSISGSPCQACANDKTRLQADEGLNRRMSPASPDSAVSRGNPPGKATGDMPAQNSGRDFSQVRVRDLVRQLSPRLNVKSFATRSANLLSSGETGTDRIPTDDKSFRQEEEEQDQSMDVAEFAATGCGVSIQVEASNTGATVGGAVAGVLGGGALAGGGLGIASAAGQTVSTGAALGILGGGALLGGIVGGLLGRQSYQFTQTIVTNAPLHGATSPYVDPHPNDDNKPFYYTDSEHASFGNTFVDKPCRGTPATGSTDWDATLCVASENEKQVVVHDCIAYGFSRDTTGAVTTRAPSATGKSTHTGILSSEFPGWTFVTVERTGA